MVFTSNRVKIEFAASGSTTFYELKNSTAVTKTTDSNVEEWDVFNNPWKQRLVTGGKSVTFAIENKLDPSESADKTLRDLIFSADVSKQNNCQLRLTFPISDPANTKPRTETYVGVVQPTADGPQGALDVSVINFDFMSSGPPVVVEEKK